MKKIIYIGMLLALLSRVHLLQAFEKHENHRITNKDIVSMDFKKISVRELLQFIAESMGFNVIMSESVAGNVSLHFQNLSWQQALDTVLEMSGFVKKQKENILFISTPSEFAARQKNLLEAAPIKTVKIRLHHADATTVSATLKSQTTLLSSFASISVNPHENSLWIKETVENLPLLTQYLNQLDKPEAQLLVTAKIINIDNKKMHELGIDFKQTSRSGFSDRLHFSFPRSGTSNLCVAIASIAQSQLLNLQLDALESSGHSKVIANPKVIAQNRKTALIEAGEEIPYQESTSSGATSITFKKAALSLKVTPIVLPDGRITMDLEINQNKTSPLAVNGTPAIQTQVLKTEIVVRNGQTVILGGIFEKAELEFINKIPLVSDIPLLGSLLSQRGRHCIRKELLILVSPRLLDST